MMVEGQTLLDEAKRLTMDALRRAPGGLSSTEVGERTGLYLDVPTNKGYISWTILQNLLLEGQIEKIGRRYRVR
jgi:hypothetical protein